MMRDLVFVSYSHVDHEWLDRLRFFFKPFAWGQSFRSGGRLWADPYISVGDKWRRSIGDAMSTGDCLRTLTGHTDAVKSVAISSDGLAVSGSEDRTIKVWDIRSGSCLRTLSGHGSWVNAVKITGDGRIVSGSLDRDVRVWDLATGTALGVLAGHTSQVNAIALTMDGVAISASDDRTLKVWDLSTNECLCDFSADVKLLNCVVASDNRTIVTCDTGGGLHYLELVMPGETASQRARVIPETVDRHLHTLESTPRERPALKGSCDRHIGIAR